MAKFSCCGQDFATEEELARHQVKVHGAPKKVTGTCCGQDFYTLETLRQHERAVHGKR